MTSTISFAILVQAGLVWMGTEAWTDLSKKVIDTYYPYGKDSMWANIIYTVILTIIILILVWMIGKIVSYDSKITTVIAKKIPRLNPVNTFIL